MSQNMMNINTTVNRGKRSPRERIRLQQSSPDARRSKVTRVEVNENEPSREEHDLVLAVKYLHVLSSKDLDTLMKDAENGIIKWTKENGSSFEINVQHLATNLGKHIMGAHFISFIPNEQHYKHVLSGIRLLYTLYDIASHHTQLSQVLLEDKNVGTEMIDLTTSMVSVLSCLGQKIKFSSQLVLLYSALLASGLYLLKAIIPSEGHFFPLVLLALSQIDAFTVAAFTSVRVVINFLHEELEAQHNNSQMNLKIHEVYCLSHLCESSLQFLQSLCQQMLIREHFVTNEKLCGEGVVLQLVQNIMRLQICEDHRLMEVVYRLKSKVLSIMINLCEVKSPSFLDMASSTTQSLDLAKSTVFEVLELLKIMFPGNPKDHPRGLLQLNAMRLTEILSKDSRFRSHIIYNLTEVLTQVFSQPQKDFLSTWCSNDHEPAEEEIVVDFDPLSAAGQVLGLTSTLTVRHSTWSNFQAPQTPYAHQMSSLLVKILANLTCEEIRDHFIDEFLECLQKESRLPGGAAERTAAAIINLSSLLAHAESLTPQCLNVEDVNALGLFKDQLEQLLATQESDVQRVTEAYSRGQWSSPTPQSPSPHEHDQTDDLDENMSAAMALIQLDQTNANESGQRQSNDVGEDQCEETQLKKRKRTKMNDIQIDIIEKASLDQLDFRKQAGSLQRWAAELSLHGPEITSTQLKNWLNNRRAKVARAAAKDASTHADGSPAGPEQDTIVIPTSGFIPEAGQSVMLMDNQGKEVGKGIIHSTRGVWLGMNLDKKKFCVVDIYDLKVPKSTRLPYEIAGHTFGEAELALTRMRVLWDSSQLLLLASSR